MLRTAALALALAASLLAGCNKKESSPTPADKSAPAPAAGQTSGAPTSAAPADTTAPPAAAPAGDEIPAAEAVRKITELADKICACPDRACAEATRRQLEDENRKNADRPRAKPTPAEADVMREQAKRMADCVEKLVQ